MEFVFTPNPPISFIGSPQKKETLIADGITVPVTVTANELLLGEGEIEVDTFSLLMSLDFLYLFDAIILLPQYPLI